ncbi:MAG TPA: isoprenylcysteine carboxylmethyltransferase family protein [Terriglobia bacterium]|nr:isoprenylcysteine carboxylmethyltransferase family protein [Terriglobia bacterium]
MKSIYWIDVFFYLCFAAFVISRYQPGARFFAGITIAAIGLSLWILARLQLGKSFSVRAEARSLVTTGLYSKFRNPIYLFAGIAFAGLFTAWGKIIPAIFFLAGYSMQFLRAKKEAKVLEDAFGEEYRRYKAKTWF